MTGPTLHVHLGDLEHPRPDPTAVSPAVACELDEHVQNALQAFLDRQVIRRDLAQFAEK